MNKPIKYLIVGSGWRSLYYIRVAKALPEYFEVCGMLCRTQEKADLIAHEYDIPVFTSMEEAIKSRPDFVVVAVDKAHITQVATEWVDRGFYTLMETPAAQDMGMMERLANDYLSSGKLVVAEQYRRYPENIARQALINKNLIGSPDYLYISLTNDHHAASLIRAFLNIPSDMAFSVHAFEKSYPVIETLTRYERYTDGRVALKKRGIAAFSFENGKMAVYDFDSEQYRSPIRHSAWKLQGVRGEFMDDTVSWIDSDNLEHTGHIEITARKVETDNPNPNLKTFEEICKIQFEGEDIYLPPFGLCGLSQDETAIAGLLYDLGKYIREEGDIPYSLRDALQDSYMAIRMNQYKAGS